MTALPSPRLFAHVTRSRSADVPVGDSVLPLGGDILLRVRHAYQRDGRLAAAATLRQQTSSLSMTDALSAIDRALGLRKPAAHY